jgi:putative DNA primase/helicase
MANTRPPKPQALTVQAEQIPPCLKTLDQWVIWRYFWLPDKQKYDKPPLNPRSGNAASTTDAKTWAPFLRALGSYQLGNYDGIGFVLILENELFGFDLDHCRDPETGHIEPWALAIVRRLNAYTEISPSRTGIRGFGRGRLPTKDRYGRKQGPIEVYMAGRYLTMTGHHLAGTPLIIEPRQAEINAFYAEVFGAEPERQVDTGKASSDGCSPRLEDDALLERALAAKNGEKFARLWSGDLGDYASQSEADLALCSLLAFWTQDAGQIDRNFRRSGLYRPKWERADYRQWTIAKALAEGRRHWLAGMTTRPLALNGDPWAGMNTLPLRAYTGYGGLRYRRGAIHG